MGYSFFDFTDDLLGGADEGCGCLFGLMFKLLILSLFLGMGAAVIGYIIQGGVFVAKWLWSTFGWLLVITVVGVAYLAIRRRQAKRRYAAELANTPIDIMQHQSQLRGRSDRQSGRQ